MTVIVIKKGPILASRLSVALGRQIEGLEHCVLADGVGSGAEEGRWSDGRPSFPVNACNKLGVLH